MIKKPVTSDGEAFLSDLGFKAASDKTYSDDDFKIITTELYVSFPNFWKPEKPGTILAKKDNSDFTITESTATIIIVIGNSAVSYTDTLKEYNINLAASDLNVKKTITNPIDGLFNDNSAISVLNLSTAINYKINSPTLAFILKFYNDQERWDSLIKLLNNSVTLIWYS